MVALEEPNRVLLVEDDPVWRGIARIYLERNNWRVTEAEDGRDGADQYRRMGKSLNIVLSDMQMPYLSGEDLARINAHEHFLPFVLCSSQYDPAVAGGISRYGVEDFLLKPVTEKDLVSVLRAAMLRRRLGAAATGGVAEEGTRIAIPASLQDVLMVQGWLCEKVKHLFAQPQLRVFIQYAHEFIMNAYEHGSLRIHEAEKGRLIESGRYEEELRRREAGALEIIELDLNIINNMVILTVTDQGAGFDYHRYLDMRAVTDQRRLMLPTGRGILMGSHYFDTVRYERNGASVALLKRVPETH